MEAAGSLEGEGDPPEVGGGGDVGLDQGLGKVEHVEDIHDAADSARAEREFPGEPHIDRQVVGGPESYIGTGRAGSAIAAEIATMVTTEQLDGLRMMSVDPVDFVVSPKALALLFVMPLLVGLFIVFAVAGGYGIAVGMLGVDGGSFMSSMEGAVEFWDDVVGCFSKAITFGAVMGLIATYRGYISEPTAAGVSAATTGTVVIGSVSILVFDFFLNGFWGV